MRKLILTFALLLPLSVMISSSSQSTPPNPRIGTFEVFRTLTENDIKAYFGTPTLHNEGKNENEYGEEVKMDIYFYDNPSDSRTLVEISIMDNRIAYFSIKIRNLKYAINGKLMVGDPVSKARELGYEVVNKPGEDYIVLNPPIYKRGNSELYFYFEVYFNTANIITKICMFEDIGV